MEEQKKRGRGRPRIETSLVDQRDWSRRQTVNMTYMYEAAFLIQENADKIPDNKMLWYCDDKHKTIYSKNGILEQIGRMIMQDKFQEDDCVLIANLSISALKNGKHSREIEKGIRTLRMAVKASHADPDNPFLAQKASDLGEEFMKLAGVR